MKHKFTLSYVGRAAQAAMPRNFKLLPHVMYLQGLGRKKVATAAWHTVNRPYESSEAG